MASVPEDFLQALLALTDKVDSPDRLALYQAYGIEYYADAAHFNLIKNALISLIQVGAGTTPGLNAVLDKSSIAEISKILEIRHKPGTPDYSGMYMGNKRVSIDAGDNQVTYTENYSEFTRPVKVVNVNPGEPVGKFVLSGSGLLHEGQDGSTYIEMPEQSGNRVYKVPVKSDNDTFAMQSDIAGISLQVDQALAKLYLVDTEGNHIAAISLGFLNNEGSSFIYNEQTEKLELHNEAGEILSTIPVSAFVSNFIAGGFWDTLEPYKFYFQNGDGGTVFAVDFTHLSSELQMVDEGNGPGYRLKQSNPDNHGNIGWLAVDLSSQTAGNNGGALGGRSFATGGNTKAVGPNAAAFGAGTYSGGSGSFTGGNGTFATETGETAFGNNNLVYSANDWLAKRIYSVGNGTSATTKSDAWALFNSGAHKFTAAPLANVLNAAKGFVMIDENGRMNIHNGAEWKALAFLSEASGGGGSSGIIEYPAQAYNQTPQWPTGTAPTGTLIATWQATKTGKKIEGRINIDYQAAGTNLSVIILPLPTGLPAPLIPTGRTGTVDFLYPASGYLFNSAAGGPNGITRIAGIRRNGSNFEIYLSQSNSGSLKGADVSFVYWTE